MATPHKAIGRRALIASALAGAAAGLAPRAHAQAKMSRAEAQYQDTPKGVQMCATCTLFLPPSACKSVEGDVAADGWCKLFDMVD
jgi:hypothetical protein